MKRTVNQITKDLLSNFVQKGIDIEEKAINQLFKDCEIVVKEKPIKEALTIDSLYDLMRRHIIHNQERPNFLLINPKDSSRLKRLFIENFGYYRNTTNDKLEFQGVEFIRSLDIEEGKPIFVK